jgi:guanylate kinase
MSHYAEFDSVIVNQDFEDAVGQLLQVLRGSPDFASTRHSLKPLIAALLA